MVCQSRGPEPGPANHHGEPNEYTHALSASDPYRNLQMLITVCSTKCSSQSALHRPYATATALAVSAETFSDHAATSYGSEAHALATSDVAKRRITPSSDHIRVQIRACPTSCVSDVA